MSEIFETLLSELEAEKASLLAEEKWHAARNNRESAASYRNQAEGVAKAIRKAKSLQERQGKGVAHA